MKYQIRVIVIKLIDNTEIVTKLLPNIGIVTKIISYSIPVL